LVFVTFTTSTHLLGRKGLTFAKAYGLPVSGKKVTLLRGVRPVLIETAMNLFVISTFRLDY
jgi:hypothetical protein